jgi:hypothetical protein
MSKPIKETPILCGKDSKEFIKKITYNEKQVAPKEEYDRIMKIYHMVKIKEFRL